MKRFAFPSAAAAAVVAVVVATALASCFLAAVCAQNVYAADAPDVPALELAGKFGGSAVSLSLAGAIDRYKDIGKESAAASIGRTKAEIIANSASAKNPVPTQRRSFARSQGPLNYQAMMNAVTEKVAAAYYQVQQSQAFVDAEKGNYQKHSDLAAAVGNQLAQHKAWLEDSRNTGPLKAEERAQRQADMAACAEDLDELLNDLAAIKASAEAFAVDLEAAIMKFNAMMDYDIMQKTVLTDMLPDPKIPATPLEDGIRSALAERNEIKDAAHKIVMENLLLGTMRLSFPPNAEEVIEQMATIADAEASLAETLEKVEIEVRDLYSRLQLFDTGFQDALAAKGKIPALKPYQVVEGKSNMSAIKQVIMRGYTLDLKIINFKAMSANTNTTFDFAVKLGTVEAGI